MTWLRPPWRYAVTSNSRIAAFLAADAARAAEYQRHLTLQRKPFRMVHDLAPTSMALRRHLELQDRSLFDGRPVDADAEAGPIRRMDIALLVRADHVGRAVFEGGIGHRLLKVGAIAVRQHDMQVRGLGQRVAPALDLHG